MKYRMIASKIFIFFLVFIIAMTISYSFQANSSNFKLPAGIVSSGGDTVNSSSYKNYVATGIIAGIVNSSTYKNFLGFFYTWLLANDQPCTADNQCEGGFCCSNLCSSSSCPTTTTTTTTEGGGGGAAEAAGGGGGFFPLREEKDYSLSKSSIKAKLALGEYAGETLRIRNTGQTAISVSLDVKGINEYLYLSDNVVDLELDEDIEVTLNFVGKKVGAFAGSIVATADEITKIIPVVLEVITKLVLFDVKLDIPSAYVEVEPGDELKTQITLLNVGIPEKVDVIVTYRIVDLSGNTIYEETETFAVERQISYTKLFKIDEFLEPGNYVAIVEVRYADSFAVSSQLFKVVEKKKVEGLEEITKNTNIVLILLLIMVGFVLLLIYKLAPIRKIKAKKDKIKREK